MKTYLHLRSIIAVIAILFISASSLAQTQPPVTTIPTLTCQEGTFTVPVTVKHFNEVGNISLSLNYDPAKLTFENIVVNNAIPVADLVTTTPPNLSGNIRLSYSGTSGITLPDETVLFTLTFSVKPGVSGVNTPVVWSTLQGECELLPPFPDAFNPIVSFSNFSTYFVNGGVDIKSIPTISGPISVCPGSTGNIYTTQSGMSAYTWNVSAGGTITAGCGTNSITVTWPASIGSHSVSLSYTDPTNGCMASNPTIYPVTIENTVAPTISGPNNVCEGVSGLVYSTQPGMTNYQWSITGGSITSGGGLTNNTATITWNSSDEHAVTVNYTLSGGCTTLPSEYYVTVNSTVGAPTAITVSTGIEPSCQLSNSTTKTTYSTTALNNSGFEWSLSNNTAGIIDPSSGIMTWANGFSGSVDIRVRALGCNRPSSQVIRTVVVSPNVGTPTPITVSVGTEPTMQLTGSTTTTTTYSTTATGSSGFNWSISNSAAGIITPVTGVMTWANTFSGNVDIQVTANGCNGPSSRVIRTVSLAPKAGNSSDNIPVTKIPTLFCQVDNVIVPVTVRNFNGVGNISLTLNYDKTKLAYTGVIVNPALQPENIITTVPHNSTGQFRLSYSGSYGITLPENTVLFTLTLAIKKGVTDLTTPLTWSTLQGECDYSPPAPDFYTTPISSANFSTYFINGSAALNAIPTITGPNSVCPSSSGNVYTTEPGMSNYIWNVSTGGTITAGAGTNSITVTWPASVSSYTVSVNYVDPTFECSEPTTTYYPVNVASVISPTLIGPNNVCQGSTGNVYNTEPNMSNYHWIVTGGYITSGGNSSSNTATVTWNNSGERTISVDYIPAGGCASTPTVYPITVTQTVGTPTTIIITTGIEPTCQLTNGTTTTNYSTTATDNTGFNWSLSNPSAGAINPTTGLMTWANGFSGVVDIRVTANGCNGPSAQTYRRVTVTTAPTAAVSYAGTPFCNSIATPQLATLIGASGGTFSSTSGLSINPSTGVITPNTSSPGTYIVTYITPNEGCQPISTTTSVTITASPTATISYACSPFCKSVSAPQPVTQTGTTGGTYSSTSGLTIDASTGAITPFSSTAGTYTVTYTIVAAGGCSEVTTNTSVTITTAPKATISYEGTPFCKSVSTPQPVTQTGTEGGTYCSTTGLTIDAYTGAITPSSSTAGTYTVTYAIAAAGGCSQVTATTSVTINNAPSANISYAGSPFCNSADPVTVILMGTTDGTYSATPAGLCINATTGTITPGASSPGVYTVSYTIPAAGGCAVVTATTSVTITAAPFATISYAGTPFCSSFTSVCVSLTGTTGGTFTAAPAGLTIDTSTGTIIPSTSTPGSYIVTYTIQAVGGCAQVTATTTVTIDPNAVGGSLSTGTALIYLGQSTGLITLSGQTGTVIKWQKRLGLGTWTDIANIGIIYTDYLNVVGTWEYRVVISSGSCGTTNSASVFIEVLNSSAGAVTGGNTPICFGNSSGTMTLSGYTGTILNWEKRLEVTGTWTTIANTATTYEETPSTPGTWYYRGVVDNSTIMYSAPSTIEVYALSVGGTVSSDQTICSTTLPSDLTLSGYTGTILKWQKSSDAGFSSSYDIAVTSNTLSGSTIGLLSSNTWFRAVVQNGTCSTSNSGSVRITVNQAPSATISYGGSPFCKSISISQSVTLTGTTGGKFKAAPSGLSINCVTGAITPSLSSDDTYTVTYTIAADGGCNVVKATTTVTITKPPTATISYAGSPFCKTIVTAQPVTRTGSSEGIYSASPAGLSINTTTGAITPGSSTAGIYTVTYTMEAADGCGPVSATASVTITTPPLASISYAGTPFCKSIPTPQVVTQTGSDGGTYSAPSGLTIDVSTGVITPNTSTAGTYIVTYTIAGAGGCSAVTATTSVTIATAPSATIYYLETPFCSSEDAKSVTLTGTTGGVFSAASGLSIDASTGTIIPGTSTAGTYTVTYTILATGGCSTVIATTSVTINETPTAPVIGTITQPTCSEATGNVVLNGLPSGSWTINPGAISGTGSSYTVTVLTANTYNFTVTNAQGCISSASGNVVINAQPDIPSAPVVGTITQPSCGIATGSVVLSGLPSGNWTINPGTIIGSGLTTTLSGLAPGTHKYIVTNTTGCTSMASANIVINNPPSIPNWNGSVSSDWNNAANWCSNAVPTASDNVTIPNTPNKLVIKASLGLTGICNNLTIESGADLTIEPGAALTVIGTLTNNSLNGIIIQSDATGTGSFIANAVTGNGTTIVQRYMTAGAWHLVSAPISGQSVSDFISNNNHIATSSNNVSRGMMDYDPVNNKWNLFFTDGIGNGNVGGGKGFAIHTNVSDIVTFNGLLQAGTQTVTGLSAGYWNCIGNPYTSAIGINRTSTSINNFLNENALNLHKLDLSYSCVYLWDQPDASNGLWGKYTIISNTPIDNGFEVQQGQAFFVLMNSGETSLTFNKNMQGHRPTLSLKSTNEIWPHIRLHVTSGNMTGTTYIAFNRSMSKGLDPTYDAGLLKGGADLAVYSLLVTDNKGVPFAIQALPDNESGMIVPIGLDFNSGGQVVFSSEPLNMPSDCKAFLEDLVERTITDLSKGDYKVTVNPKSSLKDRFRLITSKAINGVDKGTLTSSLNAYADRNIEIRVIGYVSKNTVATLYDIYGRVVLVKTLEEGSINIIPLKNNKIGAYILSVNDNGKVKGFKILVRE